MEKQKRVLVSELTHYQLGRVSKELGCTVDELISGLALSSFNAACTRNSTQETKNELLDWIAVAKN